MVQESRRFFFSCNKLNQNKKIRTNSEPEAQETQTDERAPRPALPQRLSLPRDNRYLISVNLKARLKQERCVVGVSFSAILRDL